MRSLTYVAGLVVAIAIGILQGPRETGIAMTSQVGSNCNNSGINTGVQCGGSDCSDTYDPKKKAKPWTELDQTSTMDCMPTGCNAAWSYVNRLDECTPVYGE